MSLFAFFRFYLMVCRFCLLYILTDCIRVSSSFSFLANSLMLSLYIRWLILSCDLWSLYPSVHFLSMWLSDIIDISNSNVDCASPWMIPLWSFTSVKLFPRAVSFTLKFSIWFSINFVTSLGILHILRQSITKLFWTISYVLLLLIHAIAKFFRLVLISLGMYWSMYSSSPVPLVLLRHPFCSSGNSSCLISE